MSTERLQAVLDRALAWPLEDQEELAELALDIEARRNGDYHAEDEELDAIDEALRALDRGEVATDEEVEAVFARHRDA